jgi:hypothetical protein
MPTADLSAITNLWRHGESIHKRFCTLQDKLEKAEGDVTDPSLYKTVPSRDNGWRRAWRRLGHRSDGLYPELAKLERTAGRIAVQLHLPTDDRETIRMYSAACSAMLRHEDADRCMANYNASAERMLTLMEGLTAMASKGDRSSPVKEAVRQAGPEPPKHLNWPDKNGKLERHELPPRLWAVLNCVWKHDRLPIQDVAKEVWKNEGLDVADATIRTTVSRLNSVLAEIGIPWTYRVSAGYITKE